MAASAARDRDYKFYVNSLKSVLWHSDKKSPPRNGIIKGCCSCIQLIWHTITGHCIVFLCSPLLFFNHPSVPLSFFFPHCLLLTYSALICGDDPAQSQTTISEDLCLLYVLHITMVRGLLISPAALAVSHGSETFNATFLLSASAILNYPPHCWQLVEEKHQKKCLLVRELRWLQVFSDS